MRDIGRNHYYRDAQSRLVEIPEQNVTWVPVSAPHLGGISVPELGGGWWSPFYSNLPKDAYSPKWLPHLAEPEKDTRDSWLKCCGFVLAPFLFAGLYIGIVLAVLWVLRFMGVLRR